MGEKKKKAASWTMEVSKAWLYVQSKKEKTQRSKVNRNGAAGGRDSGREKSIPNGRPTTVKKRGEREGAEKRDK